MSFEMFLKQKTSAFFSKFSMIDFNLSKEIMLLMALVKA